MNYIHGRKTGRTNVITITVFCFENADGVRYRGGKKKEREAEKGLDGKFIKH